MSHITDKLFSKKWGVFNHYLYHMVVKDKSVLWNEAVNSFDVKKMASSLAEIGAGYYVITLCQGTKYMLAPNDTYNKLTGSSAGEACAKRDLVAELYDELAKYDIDLYLYFPSDGPHNDREFGKKIGFYYKDGDVYNIDGGSYSIKTGADNRVLSQKLLTWDYIHNWSAVLEEYAVRYGSKISGWWFDGFYDFFGFDDEKIKPFYDAVKKGNLHAITAFNNGVKKEISKWYNDEEFTAGEFNELEYIPRSRFIDGTQSHILAPLGSTWGAKDARYSGEYMNNYIKAVNKNGGVVTLDIAVECDGSFSEEQMKVLKCIDSKNYIGQRGYDYGKR